MFKWKKAKCKVCSAVLPSDNAIIRLETSEGVHEIDVCNDCADFFEKSAEVLMRKNVDEEDEE